MPSGRNVAATAAASRSKMSGRRRLYDRASERLPRKRACVPRNKPQNGQSQPVNSRTGQRGRKKKQPETIPERMAPAVMMITIAVKARRDIGCAYFLGVFSSVATTNCQYFSTLGMWQRSSGVWGERIVGPKLTMSMCGYCAPMTPHSSPA